MVLQRMLAPREWGIAGAATDAHGVEAALPSAGEGSLVSAAPT